MTDPVELALLVVVAVSGACVSLLLAEYRPHALHYLVGASAGLFNVEVAKIHIFTIVCVGLAIVDRRTAGAHRGDRRALIMVAVAILALSVPLGTDVRDSRLVWQLLILSSCAAFIAGRADPQARERMLWGLLAIGVLGSLVALGQKAGVVSYVPYVDASGSRVTGIYKEPDWLGLYASVSLILLFELQFGRHTSLRIPLGMILVGALLLTGARAAWGGLVVSLLVVLFIQHREEHRTRSGFLLCAMIGVPLLLIADPSLVTSLTNRLSTGASLSATERTLQQHELSRLAATAPWHGLGLSASGSVGPLGQIIYGPAAAPTNSVASNWILGWWVDGKYLALPIIFTLVGTMLVTIRRVGGVLLLIVLFNSLYSNAVVEPILWFALGFALGEMPGDVSVVHAKDDITSVAAETHMSVLGQIG